MIKAREESAHTILGKPPAGLNSHAILHPCAVGLLNMLLGVWACGSLGLISYGVSDLFCLTRDCRGNKVSCDVKCDTFQAFKRVRVRDEIRLPTPQTPSDPLISRLLDSRI
jgi:hypothetical protein